MKRISPPTGVQASPVATPDWEMRWTSSLSKRIGPRIALMSSASIATDFGSCADLLNGRTPDDRALGPGGLITPMACPGETARAVLEIHDSLELRHKMRDAMRARVEMFYDQRDMVSAYGEIYETYEQAPDRTVEGAAPEAPVAVPSAEREDAEPEMSEPELIETGPDETTSSPALAETATSPAADPVTATADKPFASQRAPLDVATATSEPAEETWTTPLRSEHVPVPEPAGEHTPKFDPEETRTSIAVDDETREHEEGDE